MIIDISSALKHPGQSFSFSVAKEIDDIELYGYLIEIEKPIKVDGTIMYTGSNFFVKGFFDVGYSTECALCFKEVKGEMSCEFNEQYILEDALDSPDVYSFIGNSIDITKMIVDNTSLALPLKYLCTDECKGLCPKCGQNLNAGTCDCNIKIEQSGFNNEAVMNKKENPFAVLENLFSDEDKEA